MPVGERAGAEAVCWNEEATQGSEATWVTLSLWALS